MLMVPTGTTTKEQGGAVTTRKASGRIRSVAVDLPSFSDRRLVTCVVLGTPLSYDPRQVLKKLSRRRAYADIRKLHQANPESERIVQAWVIYDIYKGHGTPISIEAARGIRTIFLGGHSASVQILIAAKLLTIDPT